MYSLTDHLTWESLISNRKKSFSNQACELYLNGLDKLQLPIEYIPDTIEMNNLIQRFTNWQMVATNELITSTKYYNMLINCQFPAITTIRSSNEINFYTSAKPDVIHEYFGHGPFLIDIDYGNFMKCLAEMALTFNKQAQGLIARLFWFTIEFGLIQTNKGLRAYGAGIIPSESETMHALYDHHVQKREFNLVDILRTPFTAIDKQMIYYVISEFDVLYSISKTDLKIAIDKAINLGSFQIA